MIYGIEMNMKDVTPPKVWEEKKPSRIKPKWSVWVPEWKTYAFFFTEDACASFMKAKGL